jgi:hypothetical protein
LQVRAVISLESFTGHPGHNIPEWAFAADDVIIISYNRHADVYCTYFDSLGVDFKDAMPWPANATGLPAPDDFDKRTDALAAVFVSNCRAPGRKNYLEQLLGLLPIHSYGGCLRSQDVERPPRQSWAAKANISQRYSFHLAMEVRMERRL